MHFLNKFIACYSHPNFTIQAISWLRSFIIPIYLLVSISESYLVSFYLAYWITHAQIFQISSRVYLMKLFDLDLFRSGRWIARLLYRRFNVSIPHQILIVRIMFLCHSLLLYKLSDLNRLYLKLYVLTLNGTLWTIAFI